MYKSKRHYSGRLVFEDSTENVKANLLGEDKFVKLLNELTSNTLLGDN